MLIVILINISNKKRRVRLYFLKIFGIKIIKIVFFSFIWFSKIWYLFIRITLRVFLISIIFLFSFNLELFHWKHGFFYFNITCQRNRFFRSFNFPWTQWLLSLNILNIVIKTSNSHLCLSHWRIVKVSLILWSDSNFLMS